MSGFLIEIKVNFNKIPQLLSNLEMKPPEIIETLGKQTLAIARSYVAKDTYTLHDSITNVMESPLTTVVYVDEGFYNARENRYVGDYMLPQEFGTYKMAAHPFFTPAAEEISPIVMAVTTWTPIVAI